MPNDSRTREAPGAAHPELVSFLKGQDNPFDLFVAARRPEADFDRYHVAGLNQDVFDPLTAILERYRPSPLQWEHDLPRSGVVVILGVRGSGKTHTVHALQRAGLGQSPRLVVTPSIYETAVHRIPTPPARAFVSE
jgi:hypothetical protein